MALVQDPAFPNDPTKQVDDGKTIDDKTKTGDDKTKTVAEQLAEMAASLKAAQDELAGIKSESTKKAEEAAAKEAADAAAKKLVDDAKLTDAQRTAQELEALKKRVGDQDTALIEQSRTSMLDQLGVDPAYRRVFPEGDARDPKVKAAIEKFAADHPRLLTGRVGPTQPVVPDLLAKMSGKPVSKLVNPAAMQQSYAAAQAALK